MIAARNAGRDQQIVARLRTGATLRKVGAEYGLSYERVRQIWQRAMRRKREAVARSRGQ